MVHIIAKEKMNVKERKSISISFVSRISIDESQVPELAPQYLQETKPVFSGERLTMVIANHGLVT